MKAAVLYGPRNVRVEEVKEPSIGQDEVLIRVEKAGICGTDVEIYEGGHSVPLPRIIGHEYSGTIARVGSEVEGLEEGDCVLSEAGWPCGICPSCRAGRSLNCQDRRTLGRSVDGAFAEFVRVPARIVYLLPEGTSHQEIQSTANLAAAVRAVRQARIVFGDHVALIGSGHAALLLLQVLKAGGAGRITVIGGERRRRLDLAAELGADEVIQGKSKDGQERVRALAREETVDIVLEASGSPDQLERSLQLVKPGGKIVVFGIFPKKVETFDANLIYQKEAILCGVRGGGGGYPVALDLLKKKQVLVSPLISHDLPLEAVDEGLRMIADHESSVVRVLISP